MKGRLLLVIPAYRESKRLPLYLPKLITALEEASLPVRLVIVDDGSGVDETVLMEKSLEPLVSGRSWIEPVYALPVNQGKGGAVYAGWDLATEEEEWLAFVDADGAVPAAEVVRLAQIALSAPSSLQALVGVRMVDDKKAVKRTWVRKFIGQVFRYLVRLMFHLPVSDTQCGLKFVRRSAWQNVRLRLSESRFCFDVELLATIYQNSDQISGEPIQWVESPGGTVKPFTIIEMLFTLFRLRRKFEETSLTSSKPTG